MSRIGKEPVALPKGVSAKMQGRVLLVEGPRGKLTLPLPDELDLSLEAERIVVTRRDEAKLSKSLHGTFRALINNLVIGVTSGFKKELDIIGVGYKAQLKGKTLVLNMGFSHQVEMTPSSDLKVSCSSATHIVVEGIDRQKVGQFSAKIRAVYPPEPYKGKGIRYSGEEVRKKLGKALAK